MLHKTLYLVTVFALLLPTMPATASSQSLQPVSVPASNAPQAAPAAQGPGPLRPVVGYSIRNDVSPVLRDIKPIPPEAGETIREIPMFPLPKGQKGPSAPGSGENDSVLQNRPGLPDMPSPIENFEGVNNRNGVYPPDTQGDVGYDPATNKKYYVQWVNLSYAMWDVTGISPTLVLGPVNGNTLWTGFGGPCETTNHGDPITLYDPLAHRWLMSQFSVNGPYYQCIAISTSADPTGTWYRYAFEWHNGAGQDVMNDYPKFGVWPDAYYMTANQFGAGWAGAGVAAFDRANMLNGNPATFIYFDLYGVNPSFGGVLPADLDGTNPPPTGAPNYFAEVDDDSAGMGPDAMRLWKFHADWTTPANSTFGINGRPNYTMTVASFTPICPGTRNCIPQPGTSQGLDAIGDRLMYRLAYRNFGDHESLVVNHTVDAGAGRAGVRWYEIRDPGGTPSIYQQGTYAPADTEHRWMGSINMDHNGNMALGYSVSSNSIYPSIRYTGRQAGDPLGTLPQGETEIIAGSGSQTASGARWGDYSTMSVDPVDDCTFWYTQEYIQTTGPAPWQTRIASWKFSNCSMGSQGTLRGTVSNGNPIVGAQVQATSGPTQTGSTTSGAGGAYSVMLPVGTYTVTGSAYGYQPATTSGVSIVSGTTTTQNIQLTPVAMRIVSGTVTDAITGWPLYAHIAIQGNPYNPPAPYNDFWNDPVTGFYSVTLAEGITYTFNVNAWVTGYDAASRSVGPLMANRTENIALTANATTCNAPGYRFNTAYTQDFEASNGGYTISFTTTWAWGAPTSGPGSAHSGVNVWATNLSGNYNNGENGYLISPDIDLSAYAGQSTTLQWWQWLQTESCCDFASVEASNNGGISWSLVYGPVGGNVDSSWTQRSVTLDSSYAVSNFRVRFHFTSDYSVVYPGWYVDDVQVTVGSCALHAGGLVVGNTYDANTSAPLAGAIVSNDSGRSATTVATVDPAVDDSFYTLFSPAGSHIFTATKTGGYGASIQTPTVVQSSTIRQNFSLPAGRLSYTPSGLQATLQMGLSTTLPLTLANSGGLAATFELLELDKGMSPLGPFQKPDWVIKPFKQNRSATQGLDLPNPPSAPPYAAGDVIQSWPSSLAAAWGIAYDKSEGTVWVASPAPNWSGNNTFYEYTTNGTQTGRTHLFSWNPLYGPADAAYNWNTGMLWVMNVDTSSSNNCIYEIDPASGYTGNRICPGGGFSTNQRGLAYDPSTDTWYAGSWNDLMIHHFDSTGVMLDEVNVGLAVAGLAYNPDTQHLFVIVNDSPNPVYVLDAANNYAVLGQFSISGFGDYSGAGLEIDCDGHLWAVNETSETVYEVDSGETTSVCSRDVPWLSESPISGTVAALTNQRINVTFDAGVPQVAQPGQYRAQLKIKHNTPYNVTNVPVTMTVNMPATYGKLTGTVTGLAHCDAPGSPLDEANVFVQGSTGMTWTLTTNVSGTYQAWLDQANSPLTATVSHADYVTQTATGINVIAPYTTTQNFSLRLDAPCVSVSPNKLDVAVTPGLSKTVPLTLTNSGAAAARFQLQERSGDFSLSRPVPTQLQPEGHVTIVHENKNTNPGGTPQRPVGIGGGGPDPFGYTYKDSREAGGPSYDWIEIAPLAGGTGITITAVTGVDDGYYWPLPLPFSFNFYGTDYITLAVASNGTVYFEDHYLGLSNVPIPGSNSYGVNTFIAHLWDDLYVFPGAVYYNAEADRFIVEYYRVSGCCATPDSAIWEVILFQNGNILLQYKDVTFGSTGFDYGAGATVGIQMTTTTGLQYSYNTAALTDTLAICFAYPGQPSDCSLYGDVPWLSEYPVSGTVGGDTAFPISITFTAPTTTGIYTATLVVNTDDAAQPQINIPVTMTVGAPNITVSPMSLTEALVPDATTTRMLTIGNGGNVDLDWNLAQNPGVTWLDELPMSGTVIPSNSTGVVITFTAPPTVGVYTTTIEITSNDPAKPQVDVPVTLTVALPDLVISKSGPATATPGGLVTYTIVYTNVGQGPAAGVQITDTLPVSMTAIGPTTWNVGTVPPGASGTRYLTARLDSLPAGTLMLWQLTNNVVIATANTESNTANNSAQWTLTVLPPDITVSPTMLGATLMQGTTISRTLTIRNVGGSNLTWTLAENPATSWLDESPANGTVAPSGNASVVVTFTAPFTVGVYTTMLRVTSNDPAKPQMDVPVTLTVTAPDITVSPSALAVSLVQGTVTTRALTLGNVGTGNLMWSLAEILPASWLSESPSSGTIVPGGSIPVSVTFDAHGAAVGVYTTTLSITSNDPDDSPVNVSVMLTVTSACVSITGTNFNFTPAAPLVGQAVTFTGTVTAGTLPITYTWNWGDGSAAQVGDPIVHTFLLTNAQHTYTVTLTAANACSQPTAQKLVTIRPRTVYLPIITKQ